MKKILILWLLFFAGYKSHAQANAPMNVDLEKLTFKEDPRLITKDRGRSADRVEPLSTLPAYSVYRTKGYSFGPVKLDDECYTQFLLNSVEKKDIVGLVIGFETEATSKAINKYIFGKYRRKPEVLEKQVQLKDNHNKPYLSGSAYLWRNVRPGVSMFLSKGYGTVVNGKTIETSELVFIKNDVKCPYPGSFKSVLDRMIATFKIKHDHD